MALRRLKAERFQSGNVTSFPQGSSAPDGSSEALELVYRAADMFRELEERVRDTEARAHAMCREAAEQLRQAEARAEAAERAHRELAVAADQKLCEASSALEQRTSSASRLSILTGAAGSAA